MAKAQKHRADSAHLQTRKNSPPAGVKPRARHCGKGRDLGERKGRWSNPARIESCCCTCSTHAMPSLTWMRRSLSKTCVRGEHGRWVRRGVCNTLKLGALAPEVHHQEAKDTGVCLCVCTAGHVRTHWLQHRISVRGGEERQRCSHDDD